MKNLEDFARKLFIDYAYRQTGTHLDWRYLSSERKLSWLQEVATIFNSCLESLEKDILIPSTGISGLASYERGFLSGQQHENLRLSQKIETLKLEVQRQLEEFKTKTCV